MNYSIEKYPDITIEIATLSIQNGTKDYHAMVHVDAFRKTFSKQMSAVCNALLQLFQNESVRGATVVFARCFLSDAANQQSQAQECFSKILNDCTVSYVQQPPLDGSKIAFWLHLQTDVIRQESDCFRARNGFVYGYTSDCGVGKDAYAQTLNLLEEYERRLHIRNFSMANHCIRTWLFTRDIDTDYAGMVEARKTYFSRHGLTAETHYIASTGIEGRDANACVKVKMDSYLVKGLEEGQMQFLYAKDWMSPTHQYGVTFERGVYLDFGDRRNVYISGTASIDQNGNVLYVNDVRKQTYRVWENVEALLHEANCDWTDLMQIIVYLRDIADYATVRQLFDEKFPQTPKMIVLASICRTQWLVEMECIASKPMQNPEFRNY